MLETRKRQLVQTLWTEGRLSRWELHQRTGITPNRVGDTADALIQDGVLRECTPSVLGAGRPRVPLEIDPARRHILGLALLPGEAEVCRLGLRGTIIGEPVVQEIGDPVRLVGTAAALLSKMKSSKALGVGVSVTGFIDPLERTIIFSSALAGGPVTTLGPIYEAAGTLPVVLENDMHALAARWLLTHRADQNHDVLLVWIGDGRLGAAMLIDGKPNGGCTIGANDLGHSKFPIETRRCFCGHKGCLERIVSTEFLHDRDQVFKNGKAAAHYPKGTLTDRIALFKKAGADPALDEIMNYLSFSLSNAVNFVRPHRVVLVSDFIRNSIFAETLAKMARSLVLPAIAERVRFDFWDQPTGGAAETAAWLGMAELLYGGWKDEPVAPSRRVAAARS
jgi:predicted NBD/HSP70 family sugar kinase